MKLSQALRSAADELSAAGCASPLVDARLIAAHLLHTDVGTLFFHDDIPAGFWELVHRRATREPLQWILGSAPFGPLDLKVGPGVFIPRPETEILADWAVNLRASSYADLCTGSGAIAAYIAHSLPHAHVCTAEKSPEAARYARNNGAPNLWVGDVLDTAACVAALDPEGRGVDVVVSNPPYVPETVEVSPEVKADPHEAVFAGNDGMSFIPRLARTAFALLKPSGRFGVEHDDATQPAVCETLEKAGFSCIKPLRDFAGKPRFVTAVKPVENKV
ncbi:MAG: peptide chain release factor N(5)-glutamine methyltransferase [Corynebacterium glucuronolyticum]|nr:peptide chain release factor N(5)-glutamine methyltransferase [Corynebacterium glucuronolyticum]